MSNASEYRPVGSGSRNHRPREKYCEPSKLASGKPRQTMRACYPWIDRVRLPVARPSIVRRIPRPRAPGGADAGRRVRARAGGRRDHPGQYGRGRAGRLCLSRRGRREGMVAVRGVELFVRRVGQGSPAVVLHGGPGAHHDYLLPGLRRPRRRPGADLLRPARRRPLAGGARRGGGLDRARGRSRRPADGVGARAADARGIFVGWAAGAAVRRVRTPAGWAGSRWCRPRPRGGRRATSSRARSPGAISIPPFRRRGGSSARAGSANGIPRPSSSASSSCRSPRTSSIPERARDLTPFRVTGRTQQEVWQSLGDYDLRPAAARARGIPALVLHGEEDPIPIEAARTAAELLGAEFHPCPALRPRAVCRGVRQPFGIAAVGRLPRSALSSGYLPAWPVPPRSTWSSPALAETVFPSDPRRARAAAAHTRGPRRLPDGPGGRDAAARPPAGGRDRRGDGPAGGPGAPCLPALGARARSRCRLSAERLAAPARPAGASVARPATSRRGAFYAQLWTGRSGRG